MPAALRASGDGVNAFDVAARLAEGRPAVDDVEQYVAACHRLGYQHEDLTMHSAQVRDWYGSEDGLDLRALDADCAVLSAVAAAALDACRMQTDLTTELSAAWSGTGASVAREFVWRSGRAATSVGMSVRSAAEAASTLRDALWRAVDEKVAAVVDVDVRHRAQRADWLTAARTVTTGVGDLAAASELIDQQVKPFVRNDIESDWLGAMRSASVSVKAAYAAAIASMTGGRAAVFEVPGELGPRVAPGRPDRSSGFVESPSAPAQPIPAAVGSGPMPAAAPVTPAGVPPPAPWGAPSAAVPPPSVDPGPPPQPASSSMPSPGGLGASTPTLGAGLSGFGQQLADLIGGLVGSSGDGASDNPEELDDPDDPDDPEELDDPDDPDAERDDGVPVPPTDVEPEEPEAADESEVADPETGPAPPPTPTPPPPDSPPVAQAVPEPVANAAEPTPCEIAADELPQVGE
jgi:hypothetical protein